MTYYVDAVGDGFPAGHSGWSDRVCFQRFGVSYGLPFCPLTFGVVVDRDIRIPTSGVGIVNNAAL